MSIRNILKNAAGEFEVGRTILVAGGASAITAPLIFTGVDMYHGAHFDITAFCLAYPSGIGALNSMSLFSIGKKGKDGAIEQKTLSQAQGGDNGANQ